MLGREPATGEVIDEGPHRTARAAAGNDREAGLTGHAWKACATHKGTHFVPRPMRAIDRATGEPIADPDLVVL